jgi:hypothetical protein
VNTPLPNADDIFKKDTTRTFACADDTYVFSALGGEVELRLDRLTRERGHLIGEIRVRCGLAGARTFGRDGRTLFTTRVNLMFHRDKVALADACRQRAQTRGTEVPWLDYVEDFVQRVIETEKEGEPVAWVARVPRPAPDRALVTCGVPLFLDHPQILFGAAATGKSLLALAMLGDLGRQGLRTLILDWEMDASVHRERADAMGLPPTIAHMRCAAPLTVIADAVKQRCIEHDVQFVLLDSVILACDGPPEDATVAKGYNAALRRIGHGSLSIAHTRAEDPGSAREPSHQRPFGSVVWHNSARATWFLKRVNAESDPNITLGVYNPKASFRGVHPPFGLTLDLATLDHTLDNVTVRHTDIAAEPELAPTLPLAQRLAAALADGKKTQAELVEELGAKPASVKAVLHRYKGKRFALITSDKDGVHRWGRLEVRHTVTDRD